MRGKLPEGYFFQLTLCLNAWSQDTWIYERFFKGRLEDDYEKLDDPNTKYMDYYDPNFRLFGRGLYLHKSTYKCNEFRDPDYDLSAAEMKRIAPEIYKVHFLGMWGNATESVYPEFNDRLVRPIQDFTEMRFASFAIGVDTGYSDGAGHKITVKKGEKASEKVKAATGCPAEIAWDSTKPDGTPRKLCDTTLIRSLGWKPKIDLDTGLAMTVEDYRAALAAGTIRL